MKDPEAELASEIADLTYQLLENCQTKLEFIAKQLGLSVSEFKCLRSFEDDSALHVKEIAGRMNVTSSRMTRIVDGLVDKRYCVRDFDPADRRSILVSLTEEGRNVMRLLNTHYLTIHREILAEIPEQSRSDVVRALNSLARAMRSWIGK